MNEKFFIFTFLVLGIYFGSFVFGNKINDFNLGVKVDNKIYERFDAGEEKVRVIVQLKDEVKVKEKNGLFSVQNREVKVNRAEIIGQIGEEKIRYIFSSSNSFSAELTEKEIKELKRKGEVEKVYYDYSVRAFLQDSVGIINATPTWDLALDGINLTGAGQTICIIDTGVDFTHSDLGGCEKIYSNVSSEVDVSITSPNYPENYPDYSGDCYFEKVKKENNDKIQLFFSDINISSGDLLFLTNRQDTYFWWYTNESYENIWSPIIPENYVGLFLCTNSSDGRGYNITKVKMYNITSECNKVIGGHDFAYGTNNLMDFYGHGTHVAGIASAKGNINGIAPDSKIVSIKSLNDFGSGYSSDVIAGIEWCTDNAKEHNISIISMSLGEGQYNGYCDSENSFTASINNAISQNISVVISTGNTGPEYLNPLLGIASPSCITNSTRVTATNKNDTYASYAFRNSNFSDILSAPGTSINSTCLLDDQDYQDGYCIKQGTSMSTPHVAGAIAIINQLLALTNRTMTPKEIESVLNLTGKKINDTEGTNLNYSRIDIYHAILYLDNIEPEVYFVSPPNNEVNLSRNKTFICNTTDWQLKNVTLKIWNSIGGLYFNETKNISGISNETSFNITNISFGNYEWNCFVYDEQDNMGYYPLNFSFFVGGILVNLSSPENDTYTNVNETNFTCQAFSDENYNLTNITFYLWNSTGFLINNQTENISGTNNQTTFTFMFGDEGNHTWNCVAFNNIGNSSSGEYNYTIFFDITAPEISGLSVNGISSSSAIISWETNEPANSSSNYGGGSSESSTTHSITLSGLSSSTKYNFNITSCDRAGNCVSEEGSFTTLASVKRSSGGGSVSTISSIVELKEDEPVNKSLAVGDKFTFKINKNQYTLKILEIREDKVRISIESPLIYLILDIGEEEKLNLSSGGYYDLLIRLESIDSGKVKIILKKINEKTKSEEELEKEPEISVKETDKKDFYSDLNFLKKIIFFFIILAITIILIKCKGIKREKK